MLSSGGYLSHPKLISHTVGYVLRLAPQSLSPSIIVYHLQDRLFILSLDATSLKNAAINLNNTANEMALKDERRIKENMEADPNRLISERTRYGTVSRRHGLC